MTNTKRYQVFLKDIFQDVIWFAFLLIVLSLFRIAFILLFKGELSITTSWKDIVLTLWYGLRISLKSAGVLTLPVFVFGTLLHQVVPLWNPARWRLIWGSICLVGLSFLFQTRIPYYHEFHSAFSPFIFNTFNDDVLAIIKTAIMQYNAISRVLLGLCIAIFLCWGYKKVLRASYFIKFPNFFNIYRKSVVFGIIILLIPFAVFVRKGGSFTYNGSIYWKNAARMSQHLLNEAILDDIQALYKASRIHKQLAKGADSLSSKQVRRSVSRLQNISAYSEKDLLPFLKQHSKGSLKEKPTHIFVIVAETYMLWPLLERYSNLPISKGMRKIINESDSIFIKHFLPASDGTMFGLTSVLLGLPEVGLVTANRESAQKPYETALSVQLAKYGYATRFFYGGFPSWENVGSFMKNQQIDETFFYSDFGRSGGGWGIPDKEFLLGVQNKIGDKPSFNLILTSSNHPPYTVDISKQRNLTPVRELKRYIPKSISNQDLFLQRLQHFEYADQCLADFVEIMKKKYPKSLFFIVGDHASRWTLDTNPSLYERISVPLVITGNGIKKEMLPTDAAGSQMDIAATLLNLVLPKGSVYYALGKDLLTSQKIGLHAHYWMNKDVIGDLSEDAIETLPGRKNELSPEKRSYIRQKMKDIQTVARWRILHGINLEDKNDKK